MKENESLIGKLLDNRYEIESVIGEGGMAVVYKAFCHRLNRFVAIKVLRDEFAEDEEFRRRFLAESHAIAMLSHPNIVAVYDVSSCDGVVAPLSTISIIIVWLNVSPKYNPT